MQENGLRRLASRIRGFGLQSSFVVTRRKGHVPLSCEVLEHRELLSAVTVLPEESIALDIQSSQDVGTAGLNVNSNISGAVVWRTSDSPITLTTNVSVQTGAELTIEPGVVVNGPGSLTINNGGTVNATAGNIHFNVNVSALADSTATFTSCFFDAGRMEIQQGSSVSLSGNKFHGGSTQGGTPLWVYPSFVPSLVGNNYTDGTIVGVYAGDITSDITWPKLANVDGYRLLNLNNNEVIGISGTLTIASGNKVLGEDDFGRDIIKVFPGGRLNMISSGLATSVGIKLVIDSGGIATFQSVRFIERTYTVGGTAGFLNCVFEGATRLEVVEGSNVMLTGNTFHGGNTQDNTPLWVYPSFVPSLAGNTYGEGTIVGVYAGDITSDVTWPKLANVDGYRLLNLNNNEEIGIFGILTIASGNKVVGEDDHGRDIIRVFPDGKLNMISSGLATSVGAKLVIDFGGTATFQSVRFIERTYTVGGTAGFLNCAFEGATRLEIAEGSNVTLTGNTFHGGNTQVNTPLWVYPSFVPNLAGNTYTASTIVGVFAGDITSDITWPKLANVDGYRLLNLNNNEEIGIFGILTIASGNRIVTDNITQDRLSINGQLMAQGVRFDVSMVFESAAVGVIYESVFSQPPTVTTNAGGSSGVSFRSNDFTQLANQNGRRIILSGSTAGTIDLNQNFWGTDVPSEIAGKIQTKASPSITATIDNFIPKGSVGNRIWNDLNSNGIQDPGEAGIEGVQIQAYNAQTNAPLGAAVSSNADRDYVLSPTVPTGSLVYVYLKVTNLPSGMILTTANSGSSDWLDNDFNPVSGRTGAFLWDWAGFNPLHDAGLKSGQQPLSDKSTPAVFRNGYFYLDANGNNKWNGINGGDQQFGFGSATDKPVTGDWNGDGITDVGAFRLGKWYLDLNGNHVWSGPAGGDGYFSFGSTTDFPVTGDWNGDGITDIGVVRAGKWYLDLNGNRKWDGTSSGDGLYSFGNATDLPVTGDWNGDGATDIGVVRAAKWYLDGNGNRQWNGSNGGDLLISFGAASDKPVVGDWNGDGKDDVGVFRNGTYLIDANGNMKWDTPTGGDKQLSFGIAGDIPLSGVWSSAVPSGNFKVTRASESVAVSERSVDQVFTAEDLGSLLSPTITRKKQFLA